MLSPSLLQTKPLAATAPDITMRREYYLNIFYQDGGFSNGFTRVQEIPDNINSLAEICLELYACDFNPEQSLSSRKKLYTEWQDLLPKLDNIKALYLRHKVDQNFFEAICRMKGLEKLCFRNSNIEDLSSIKKLKKLKLVSIDSF